MAAYLYPVMALFFTTLCVELFVDYRTRKTSASLFFSFVLLGLVVDTVTISLGKVIGSGLFLERLNLARFVAHGVFGPMSFIVVFDLLKMSGASWTKAPFRKALLALVVLLTATGLYGSLSLTLKPVDVLGVLRYVEDGTASPSWAGLYSITVASLTMVFFLAAGIVLWVKFRWQWLFIGSLVALIANGAPSGEMRFIISSIFEVVFAVAVSSSIVYIRKQSAEHA